jgi:predicted CXXCH cytochrome family protein
MTTHALAALTLSLLLPTWSLASDLAGPPPERREACRLRWAIQGYSDGSSCLTCHADRPQAHAGGRHTLGRSYAEAMERSRLRLRPEEELPRSLVLKGDRITCTTCHAPWSRAPKKLAARPAELCTTCHAM